MDRKGRHLERQRGGGVYDPTHRTITWTVTANHMGASLNNVVITDMVPSGLTFNAASWQAWTGSAWGAAQSITPNASGEYAIGNISSKILLTIVTDVPDKAYETGMTTFVNSATITWNGLPAGTSLGTGNVSVGVGYNAIGKSGVADPANRTVHWTVTVDARTQTIPNMKVYDLLVYGSSSSGFNLATVAGIPAGINTADLHPRYDQKYIAGSFVGVGLTLVPLPITQDGVRVADLLEITGFTMSALNTFTFDTLVVNPNVFAGNRTSTLRNSATLFSGTTKLNEASANVDYVSQSLAKEMLKRDAHANPAAGVNSAVTDNAALGFNYVDKTVIFRLSVNEDGLDLNEMTNASGVALGAATVVDTLPEGWEYVEIVAGSNYLIFEGSANAHGSVLASDTTPDTVSDLSASFVGRTATFTFDSLDRPYVILVKARPTSATAAQYFSANQTTTARNTASLSAENWTPGVSVFRDVSIVSTILEKGIAVPAAGELRWSVDYKPYDLTPPSTRIVDEIPIGLDIRTDATGALLIAGNITAHELTLNADGSYSDGPPVTLVAGTNVSYTDNGEKRLLSFSIPDSAKAYRFTYITDITGEPGTVDNRVWLYGGSTEMEDTKNSYTITRADGEASFRRNGWISITKIDGNGDPFGGAEFTLYASDGVTVIRRGVTDAETGILRFKVIPDGQYILRETGVPGGYTGHSADHFLTVTTTGGVVISSIDGKTGPDANTLTVQNFLEGTAGNLTITKTVMGNAGDPEKGFTFTLTLVGANGTYSYIGSGVPNGTISSGDTITLAHGQSITIMGLPKDATYTVSEADYRIDGYITTSTGETGTIVADATQTAAFTNTFEAGNLTISKMVAGNAADPAKGFVFTLTLVGADGTYSYIGNGVPDGTISSGGTITLAHGQSITVMDIPKDATYTVTEADYYYDDAYTTTSTGATGTIVAYTTQIAAFTNTRNVYPYDPEGDLGSLTISKTVLGYGADMAKRFDFTVTFYGTYGSFPYWRSDGQSGMIKSGDTISLSHGQSVTIEKLPKDTGYVVSEADYADEGYSTASTGETGMIVARATQVASFTNAFGGVPESSSGYLIIKKTVAGDLGDRDRTFAFIVELDVGGRYRYTGSKTGWIENGGVILLKHGESVAIEGIPVGTNYRVSEMEADQNGYRTSSTGASGRIVRLGQTAAFVNTKSSIPQSGIPQTGDDNMGLTWAIGMAFSLFMLLVFAGLNLVYRQRRSPKSR